MSEITASPHPVKIGDKEYLISPLTDRDLVELDHWLQSRLIARARESLPSDVSNEEYDRAMSLAYREAQKASWMSPEGSAVMGTVDGVSRVFWHQLKKNHPELTHDDVRKMCVSPDVVKLANEVFAQLNVDPMIKAEMDDKKGAPKDDRKERRRRRKRERQRRKSTRR